ncbi:hypothetical protein ARZXY2_2540 [Arthrobacter sp. ZXY-2]|nr:hypothetical protein ARZXY2_2540 [Arthrobacter sp. ZXY-2]
MSARDDLAKVLYREGAYCGSCEYEGWETCADCRRCCDGYATAILAEGYTKPTNEQAAAVKAMERITATMDEFYRSGSPENQFKTLSEISAHLGTYAAERLA